MPLERVSIEVTNRCAKACAFCYNHSLPEGPTRWTVDELVGFAGDCAAHGVKAVSFGGGEPLQFEGIFEVLARLRSTLFRSMTTNGLLLADGTLDRLVEARPDKVHVWDTMSGPYGREREPEPPIPIDRLPLVIREAAVLHRLELDCFREFPWIQPLDHWACETLTAARLDGRRIRGVAGKEEEYGAEYEQHCKNAAEWGLEIDPPVSGP